MLCAMTDAESGGIYLEMFFICDMHNVVREEKCASPRARHTFNTFKSFHRTFRCVNNSV